MPHYIEDVRIDNYSFRYSSDSSHISNPDRTINELGAKRGTILLRIPNYSIIAFNMVASTVASENDQAYASRISNGWLVLSHGIYAENRGSVKGFGKTYPISCTIAGGEYEARLLQAYPNSTDVSVLESMEDYSTIFPSASVYVSAVVFGSINMSSVLSSGASPHNAQGYWDGGTVHSGSLSSSDAYAYIVFIPKNPTPTVTLSDTDSVYLFPPNITATCNMDCSADIYVDNKKIKTISLSAGVPKDIEMSTFWYELESYTTHTISIRTYGNGYVCADKFTFTKKDTGLSVMGTPITVDDKPIACTVLSIVDHAEGEDASFYVTNNGNDTEPAWEKYTGDYHYFGNKTKSSDKWGVNWRYEVDASQATGSVQPAIKGKVAMGIIYDEAN